MTHPRVLDEQSVMLRLDNLEAEQRRLDSLVSGWTGAGGSNPYFNYMEANQATFYTPPLESFRVRRIGTEQTIADDTWTAVDWNEVTYNTGFMTLSTATNSTRLTLGDNPTGNQDKVVMFFGHVGWAESSVGTRGVRMALYSPNSTFVGSVTLELVHVSTSFEAQSFAIPFRFNSSGKFVTLEVYQDSGGNSSLREAFLGGLRLV